MSSEIVCNSRKCVEYFKSQKAYDRCFRELWKKWRSYGKVAGRITLKNASDEERRAISGITGKMFFEKDIRFTFLEFEQGLQKTRFAPVDMKIVLEEYFGKELVTRQGEKKEQQKQKEDFLESIYEYFQKKMGTEAAVSRWISEMISSKKYGYQLLMREYEKDPKQARGLAYHAGNALEKLEEIRNVQCALPLAVFAAEVSDNPHYFDRGTTAGTFLVHGICYERKRQLPENAYQWRELLEQEGIVPDNISSLVHVYGLKMKKEGNWHPAYEAFCEAGEPYVVTMENLKGITEVQPLSKKVYIVENEMVFSYLIENLQRKNYTLLCTSGQLRFAAQKLIEMILESESDIYYSGDIDPDGIRIADRLWQKYGNRIHLWRMEPKDYEKSISGEAISDTGAIKLERIVHPQLLKTAEYIREKRRSGYQENILKELLTDMEPENPVPNGGQS